MLWDCRLFGLLMKNHLAHAEPPHCLCPHWLCAVEESFMKRRAQRRHSSVCLRSAQRRDLRERPAKMTLAERSQLLGISPHSRLLRCLAHFTRRGRYHAPAPKDLFKPPPPAWQAATGNVFSHVPSDLHSGPKLAQVARHEIKRCMDNAQKRGASSIGPACLPFAAPLSWSAVQDQSLRLTQPEHNRQPFSAPRHRLQKRRAPTGVGALHHRPATSDELF